VIDLWAIGRIASLGVTIKIGVIGVMTVEIAETVATGAMTEVASEVIELIAANVGIDLSTMARVKIGLGLIWLGLMQYGLMLGRRMMVVRAAMVEATGVMIAVVNAGSIHTTRARVGVAAGSTG
jgi:hypothetical protein